MIQAGLIIHSRSRHMTPTQVEYPILTAIITDFKMDQRRVKPWTYTGVMRKEGFFVVFVLNSWNY